MDGAGSMLASAVVVPEAIEQTLSPTATRATKRRQSSSSEGDNKRARLSDHDVPQNTTDTKAEQPAATTQIAQTTDNSRRRSRVEGRDEEKQRGKRLFGALLGTLSQSSSSAAQKRRAEIERKQRDKLRDQADEDDERKRRELEELMTVRRGEQKKYDEQSMRIRHSNSLAMAGYLQTSAHPKIFYKPWKLLPRQKERLDSQILEAETKINIELERFEAENPSQRVYEEEKTNLPPANDPQPNGTDESVKATDTVLSGEPANVIEAQIESGDDHPDIDAAVGKPNTEEDKEVVGDNEDGVVVEAGEDPVIY